MNYVAIFLQGERQPIRHTITSEVISLPLGEFCHPYHAIQRACEVFDCVPVANGFIRHRIAGIEYQVVDTQLLCEL